MLFIGNHRTPAEQQPSIFTLQLSSPKSAPWRIQTNIVWIQCELHVRDQTKWRTGSGVLKWRHTLYKSLTFLDFRQSKRIRQLPKIDASESSWVETGNLQRRGSLVPAYYFLRVCIYTINDVCLIAKHEAVTEMGIQYKPCAVISHAILHGCPDLSWTTRSISGNKLWVRSFYISF